MTRTKILTLALAGIFAAGAAHAETHDARTNEAAILANAKVTMVQAIATAEQHTAGKAVGSGIEDQNGTVFFEVEVLKGDQKQKVLVDTQSGQVVNTAMLDNEQSEHDQEDND